MFKRLSIFKYYLLLAALCSWNALSAAACGDLFFSEYIEGSSNNKCVEIYNPTGSSVDLSAGSYQVQVFSNGSASAGGTINLTGTVASGDVYIVCNASAAAAFTSEADQTSGSLGFNGDDAVALVKGGTNIDVFGQIGFDPGSQWNVNGVETQNQTLIRKATVQEGDTDDSNAFDPSAEWVEFPQDDLADLGSHTADPCTVLAGCDELFFSEYIEGGGNNKCIEIYNPTGSAVDLAAGSYVLNRYTNGSSTVSGSVALTGTVASGDVYIVCNPSASSSFVGEADQTSGVLNYNGDDAVELTKGGTSIDVFGQIGFDPGSQWNVNGVETQNQTLRRMATVREGDSDGSNVFDPSAEWVEYPQDDSADLGSHTSDCIVVACDISDVTVDNISACDNNGTDEDAGDDTFTFDVTVTFADAPATGSLDLTGDGTATVDVANLDSPTSHKFVGVSGTADGGSIDVTAKFSDETTCTASDDTETAPEACSFNPCGGLFFSEYIEGSGNSKCVEVYNPTGSDIDLAADGYAVQIFYNGATSPGQTINLTGTIISGGTHVLCDDGSTTEIFNKADQITTAGLWNGDDAVVLVKGSIKLDIIGKIGENPGSNWTVNGVSTANQTLRRKASILEGDKVGGNDFDPSLEWDSYPQNDNANLGVHVSDCISCSIAVAIEGNADFCAGEDAMLDAGVYEPLANVYEWSTGETTQMISTNTPGVYTVTVTNDAGCQGTEEIKVNALASFEVSADSESVTPTTASNILVYQVEICGGKVPYSLDASSEGFINAYQLPSANSGCRIVVVQFTQGSDWVLQINDSASCGPIVIDSEDLATTDYGVMSIVSTEVVKESCPGYSDGAMTLEIDGGDNSCGTYDVSVTGPSIIDETLDSSTLPASITFDELASGTYTVTVTDCNGQTVTADIYVARQAGRGRGRGRANCDPTAEKTALDNTSINFVELYPNPFSQMTQLEFGLNVQAQVVIDVYTIDGRKAANVFNGSVKEGQNNRITFDGSDLAAGVYVLQLTTNTGVVHHEKLYITK